MATIQKVSGIDFANISKFDAVLISAVGSINFIGKPATGTLLLDTPYGSGAEAAYSVRKLRTAYNGAAMQVQATTGGATQDIGFDINGNLDTVTLLNFAGTNEVGVSIWYDQSLNGKNATQSSVSNRPIVVAAGGALVKENGKLAVFHNGDTLYAGNLANQTETFFAVFKTQAAASTWFFNFDTDNNPALRSTIGAIGLVDYVDNNAYSGNYLNGSFVNRILFRGESFDAQTQPNFKISGRNATELPSNSAKARYQEILIFTSVKSAGDITSIEENVGDYFTQNTPLLDTYSGAAAAYSLRLLDSTYTGSAIRVRRSSDNTEQDIGFNIFGELDTVSLTAFAGAGDAFCKVWYDQSGSSNDATQTTTSAQPQIVLSGAVITESGKPAVYFNTTDKYENITASISTLHSAFVVGKRAAGDRQIYGFGGGTAYNNFEINFRSAALTITFVGNGSSYNSYASSQAANTQVHLLSNIYNQITYESYVDNTASVNASETLTASAALSIGARSAGTIYISELVLYSSDESDYRTGIETNINTFYSIY